MKENSGIRSVNNVGKLRGTSPRELSARFEFHKAILKGEEHEI